ncbi:MAG: Crp/Fnr family transcriptional regulator [Pirellulaceae bacterium]|jgi:CRP/FNR family transcriptional regulator|nr:Crp/Fnr family transcriptional regulator [Pirellulaceae bacterium]
MLRESADVIRACALFAEVDPARCQTLASFSRWCEYARQEVVFRQGQECPGIYIVESGMVRVFKTSPAGKEHVLHMVGPGHTFAEVAAIGNFPCPAHAQAVEATRCLLLPLDLFRDELARDHALCLQMMAGMSFWVRHLLSLLEDLVLRDALGRTARFLLEADADDEGFVKLPSLKRHVASHLNLTSETFSRTLSRLIEAGLVVEHDKNRVALCDVLKLRAVSEGKYPQL